MTSFLLGDLAKQIHAGMKDAVAYGLTLVVVADDGSTTSVSGRGWLEEYSDFARFQGMVERGDRKVMILQQSMPTSRPRRRDRVTMLEGPDAGATFTIEDVDQDPAGALWELQGQPWQA